MTRRARFEVFRGEDGQWYWHVKGGNGEIILSSEGYRTKFNANRGARIARQVMADAKFQIELAREGMAASPAIDDDPMAGTVAPI